MSEIFTMVLGFGPILSIIALILILSIVIIFSLNPILLLLKKAGIDTSVSKKTDSKLPASNMDDIVNGKAVTINPSILLFLFETHTKYKDSATEAKHEARSQQLTFVEGIYDQMINKLTQLYKDAQEKKLEDLRLLNIKVNNMTEEEKLKDADFKKYNGDLIYLDAKMDIASKEFSLYKEALTTVFKIDLMMEVRRSFRKNGFYNIESEDEMKRFIAPKMERFEAIVTKYLSRYFPLFNKMLLKVSDERDLASIMDKDYLFNKTLEIYNEARDIWNREFVEKEKSIKAEFERDINTILLKDIFQ